MYYLKYFDKIVAEIDEVYRRLEIIEPDLFFDKFNKNVMNTEETNEWVRSRVRPQSQKGFSEFVGRLGLDLKDNDLYWKIFEKTRAVNVKDKLWLAFTYEENFDDYSPWLNVLNSDLSLTVPNNKLYGNLQVSGTFTKLNVDGACEKEIYRLNGHLAIVKDRLQENSYDHIAEELVYKIARKLGIDCAPAGTLKDYKSYSLVDENKELEHASKLINLEVGNFDDVCDMFRRVKLNRSVKIDVLRMGILDLITRQLDRNFTNFSFYKVNGNYRLYRMYDNGISLFSTVRFKDSLEYNLGYGETSRSKLNRICRELSALGAIEVFPRKLNKKFLISIFGPYRADIKNINGNNIDDVVEWILKAQNLVEEKLINMGILLCRESIRLEDISDSDSENDESSDIIYNYLKKLSSEDEITIDMIPISMREGDNDKEVVENYRKFLRS